jgi:Tfp pilus assembly protein FimT
VDETEAAPPRRGTTLGELLLMVALLCLLALAVLSTVRGGR